MENKLQDKKFSLYNALNARFGNRLTPQLQRKATLKALSNALEDAVLRSDLQPVVFTAFQKVEYYQHEIGRYNALEQVAKAVALYVEGIEGSSEKLEGDWFVVVNEPRFKALMACRELYDQPAGKDNFRSFTGFWSYDREVVDYASQLLADRFMQHDPNLQQALNEVLNTPYQPLEQITYVREVGERILNEMARTNQKAISQINRNQELLSDLERQQELLQELNQTIEIVTVERSTLQLELKRLYAELTRSQQIMTDTLIEKARYEQQRGPAIILLRQFENELELLKTNSTEKPNFNKAEILLAQIQKLIGD